MRKRTRDILRCVLEQRDIDLLEFYGHNPYKFKLVDKTAETKTFSTFDDAETINLRW